MIAPETALLILSELLSDTYLTVKSSYTSYMLYAMQDREFMPSAV